jgi:4'-phosphopantetheinyl transferase
MIEPFSQLGELNLHVWVVPLLEGIGSASAVLSLLSSEEVLSAERMMHPQRRASYIMSRGALRLLLSRYLDTSPRQLILSEGFNRKPMVPGTLKFNASHSGSLALYAFAMGCEVGVDVEEIRQFPNHAAIASRFFHRDEALELLQLPAAKQENAFFRCWTRKEAYVKATGEGLSAPLDDFRVSLSPGEPARFIVQPDASVAWSLYDIQAGPGYAAAVAHAGTRRSIEIRHINCVTELFHQGDDLRGDIAGPRRACGWNGPDLH